jgi:signal transduction histidine kinase
MSVIAVQSGVGHHVIDTDVEAARHALAAIETTSREALTEMRRMLGVLREDEDVADSLAPAPRLIDIHRILDQLRDSGVDVTVDIEGGERVLSPAVDLCAYRIIQEALTNVIKHGGRTAHVAVTCREREVDIEVTDVGNGQMAPVSGGSMALGSAGHGLAGMRERVAMFGGVFSAGRRPGGGFRISAQLPYGGPQR